MLSVNISSILDKYRRFQCAFSERGNCGAGDVPTSTAFGVEIFTVPAEDETFALVIYILMIIGVITNKFVVMVHKMMRIVSITTVFGLASKNKCSTRIGIPNRTHDRAAKQTQMPSLYNFLSFWFNKDK